MSISHKLRIIFYVNCYVQLRSLKENIKTNSRRRHWIKKALTGLPGRDFQGVLLIVSWDCSLYGKGPQDNQHQRQTKLRFHSFLYLKKNKTNDLFYFRFDTEEPNPENFLQHLYKNTEALFDKISPTLLWKWWRLGAEVIIYSL